VHELVIKIEDRNCFLILQPTFTGENRINTGKLLNMTSHRTTGIPNQNTHFASSDPLQLPPGYGSPRP